MKKKTDEKKCVICKRTLMGESKTGLCPECLNKYGTPAAGFGVTGIVLGGKVIFQNREKIVKGAVKCVNVFLSSVKK